MWHRISRWVHKHEAVLILLMAVTLLRIPTLFEPYWYGDEGIYLTIGQAIKSGEKLYLDIHDNKPPALYWVAAVADGRQFWFRMIAAGWNLLTVLVFIKLALKVWPDKKRVVMISAGIFALLTNLPLLEGNVANAELFFLLPTLTAALLLYDKEMAGKKIFLAGCILGIGGLFKIPALFEAGVWPFVWLVCGDKKWWSKTIWLGLGVVLVLGLGGIYFAHQEVLSEYIKAALGQNLGYLSSWKIGEGTGIYTLKGRAVILAIWLAIIAGLARRIGKRGVVLGTWGGLALFAALLSGRPYPHYLLQVTGVLALAMGWFWTGQKWERGVGIGLGVLVVMAYGLFKFSFYPVGSYYINFQMWAIGKITKQEYFKRFDTRVNDDYLIARIVAGGSKADETIWIWGDRPVIYALSRRLPAGKYTVKYHIMDFKEEQKEMERVKLRSPKYIVSYGQEEIMPGLRELLEEKYLKTRTIGNASVYRLSELYN